MNKTLRAGLLSLAFVAVAGAASGASQAVWQGNRVLISGTCPPDFVSLQSTAPTFPPWDTECVNGQYQHLAPEGSLAAGNTVYAFFDDTTQDTIVVPTQATSAPLLGGLGRSALLAGLLAAGVAFTRRARR